MKDIDFNLLLRIPYVGRLSHEFKSKITNLFYKVFNVESFRILKTTELSEFFISTFRRLRHSLSMLLINLLAYTVTLHKQDQFTFCW